MPRTSDAGRGGRRTPVQAGRCWYLSTPAASPRARTISATDPP